MRVSSSLPRPCGTLSRFAATVLWLVSSVLFTSRAPAELYSDKMYAIHILSQAAAITDKERRGVNVQPGYALYTTDVAINGVTWYRLRLGFFGSQKAAQDYIDTYLRGRSGIWIAVVPAAEYLKYKTLDDEQLFMKAQQALDDNRDDEAAAIYKKIIAANDPRHKASALVALGEIYERTGDTAAAIDVYRQYIALYPQALNLARISERKTTLEEQLQVGRPWVSSGEISQSLSSHTSTIRFTDPLQPPIYTERNAIITYLNHTSYRNFADSSLQLRFNGYYDYSVINQSTDQTWSANQLSLAYSTRSQTVELGRQACYGCGVNGILDGVSYAYTPVAPVEFRLSAGNPVDYASDPYTHDRALYSVNIDTRRLFGSSNLSGYYVKQQLEGVDDREATGLAFNYTSAKFSVSSNIDYDLYYDTLNYALINVNFPAEQNTNYNITLTRQRSPYLSLRNALYGQPETSIRQLLATMTLDELQQLSEERTSSSHTLTLGAVHTINNRLQASVDMTLLHRDSLPLPYEITGNVPGYGIVLGAQLMASNLFKDGDLAVASTEIRKDDMNESVLLNLSSRFPATENIELDPALALRHTDFVGELPQWKLLPSLALSYQVKDNLQIDLAGGIEYADPDLTLVPTSRSGSFYEISYRRRY